MCYALEGMRHPRPGDAEGAPLDDVAAVVLSLAWPCSGNNRVGRSRSIHEAFEELGGRYRHCDVYEAMHALVKGHELKSGRAYWQRHRRAVALRRRGPRPHGGSSRLTSSPPTSRRSRTVTSGATH